MTNSFLFVCDVMGDDDDDDDDVMIRIFVVIRVRVLISNCFVRGC